jgi:hypothetical protein
MAANSGKYNPSEFLFPSYDVDGCSARICARVPASLNYAIEMVVESRKFPFEIKDDAVLWCLNKGVETLQSMDACVSVMPLLKMLVNLFRAESDLKAFENFFIELDRTVLDLTKSDYQRRSARRLVKAVQEGVLCIRSGNDRSWFLRELRKRWGHLLISSSEQATQTGTENAHG